MLGLAVLLGVTVEGGRGAGFTGHQPSLTYLFICLPGNLPVCLFLCLLFIYLSIYLSVCLFIYHLSFSVCQNCPRLSLSSPLPVGIQTLL